MNRENAPAPNEFVMPETLTREAIAEALLPVCQILLRNEARYPWVVLVPRRAQVSEPFDLLPGDQVQLWTEIHEVGQLLKAVTGAKKINFALFGNMLPQLHVHLVARFEGDARWPGGVVGVEQRQPYPSSDIPGWWTDLTARLALKDLTSP